MIDSIDSRDSVENDGDDFVFLGAEYVARRGASKAGQRRAAADTGFRQLPFRQIHNPYPPVGLLSDDELESVHNASLDVLEKIGINFLLEEARDLLSAAGAEVEPGTTRVRFDRNLVMELMRTAPAAFTAHARNPAHNLEFGPGFINFSMIASPPNVSDIKGGRRTGNFDDFCDLVRLGQSLNIAHQFGGYPVEPIDLHPSIRHLEAESTIYKLSDKFSSGYCLGRERIRDSIEMARIVRGISAEQMQTEPSLHSTVNANSPLQYDIPMLSGIIEMARMNQPIIITPFTLAGAMAPVTLAGAVVQQNAEALAGMAFVQVVSAGCPVVYGGFTSNVDMRSGAPAFGTPEYAKAVFMGGQLARRYGVPYRSSNVNASNAPDAQAVYESQMSIWPFMMSQATLIKHALGWLEGGLCASFEKVIIDAEMLQMASEFLQPIQINEAEFGLDAMEEVGPGGHFFGAAHTLERYDNAFYEPILSDWRNFESWEADGAIDATTRAHHIYKKLLADYTPPPMDQAIAEELDAFVARRKEEGGIPTDF